LTRDETLPQRTTAISIFIPNCIASKSVPDHAHVTRHIDPVMPANAQESELPP
jgi:hypothetical protein